MKYIKTIKHKDGLVEKIRHTKTRRVHDFYKDGEKVFYTWEDLWKYNRDKKIYRNQLMCFTLSFFEHIFFLGLFLKVYCLAAGLTTSMFLTTYLNVSIIAFPSILIFSTIAQKFFGLFGGAFRGQKVSAIVVSNIKDDIIFPIYLLTDLCLILIRKKTDYIYRIIFYAVLWILLMGNIVTVFI